MGAMASQITSLTIVYSTVYLDADQRKHQSSASPAFVWGIHWWPVNSPHKGPVTRKMFPFDYVIMIYSPFNILRPRENCHHFAGDIFSWIKSSNFYSNFIEIWSQWSNKQQISINSNNGFALIRRHDIFWTDDVLSCWRIYASLRLDYLHYLLAVIYTLTNTIYWNMHQNTTIPFHENVIGFSKTMAILFRPACFRVDLIPVAPFTNMDLF